LFLARSLIEKANRCHKPSSEDSLDIVTQSLRSSDYKGI
jgi:hypothetical protein